MIDNMLMHAEELEPWTVPQKALLCLLCKKSLKIQNQDNYRSHLADNHSVLCNIPWIVKCTLVSQQKLDLLSEINDNVQEKIIEPVVKSKRKRDNVVEESSRKRRKSSTDKASEESSEEESVTNLPKVKDCYIKIKNEKLSHYLEEPDQEFNSIINEEIEEIVAETNESKSSTSRLESIVKSPKQVTTPPMESSSKLVKDDSVPALVKQETGEEWYFGTVYSCFICDLVTKIRWKFESHVKSDHNSSMKLFHRKYQASSEKYECKVCGAKVKHDKEDIIKHVDSHFLSLDKYEKLYVTNIRDIRRKLEEEKRLSSSKELSSPSLRKSNFNHSPTSNEKLPDLIPQTPSSSQPNISSSDTSASSTSTQGKDKISSINEDVDIVPSNDCSSKADDTKGKDILINEDSSAKDYVEEHGIDLDDYDSNISSMIEETLKDLDDPESTLSKLVTEVVETEDLDMIDGDQETSKPPLVEHSRINQLSSIPASSVDEKNSKEEESSSISRGAKEAESEEPSSTVVSEKCESSIVEDKCEDVPIYCCPINNCSFVTSFDDLKSGKAAQHVVSFHKMDIPAFKMKYKWRKTTLESRLAMLHD